MVERIIMADLADILSVRSRYSCLHFKASFWGLDTEIKATKCRFDAVILPSGQNVHPEMKPQILRFSSQRKGAFKKTRTNACEKLENRCHVPKESICVKKRGIRQKCIPSIINKKSALFFLKRTDFLVRKAQFWSPTCNFIRTRNVRKEYGFWAVTEV